METEEIIHDLEKARKENKKIMFLGLECDRRKGKHNTFGLIYITVYLDESVIEFTTDTSDYIKENLEDRLNKLYDKFGIKKSEILFHNSKKGHDKDIKIFVEGKIETVLLYVLKNFYSFKDWTYSFE